MISVKSKGDLGRTRKFLNRMKHGDIFKDLSNYGQLGVNALAQATPVDSGLAASSWEYRVIQNRRGPAIEWYNTNVENGAVVVILIQYGHATRDGSFVQGRDFINPAMQHVFDQIAADIWKKVMTS